MSRPPNLNALTYFEAVARHSRINQAAEELKVSPSAVSQQIRGYEQRIGVALFRRVKRRLVLTEQGERLYVSAAKAMRILRDAETNVAQKREHRKLVVRVAPTFGVRWLSERIGGFIKRYPEIDLHIDATSELTDFEKENVDLEIRYGYEPPRGLHAIPLVTDHVMPMCAPSIANAAAGSSVAEVLQSNRLIHTVKAMTKWRDWLERMDIPDVDGESGLRFDRSSMSLRAAQDGLGVVLETTSLATNELTAGSLVPLAPQLGTVSFPAYWLIMPSRYLNRRGVKAFSNWVENEALAHEKGTALLLDTLGCSSNAPFQEKASTLAHPLE